MASIIRTSNIQNTTGNAGIYLNAATGGLEINVGGFNLAFEGINIVPQNKVKVVFQTNASEQSWAVPSGVTHIYAKLWGSGGGGGSPGGWSFGSHGGGGGHTRGVVPVTPGEVLTVRVPRGGYANPGATNAPFGGGSSTGGGDNQYGSGGGGYCGLFRGAIPLLIAGGGGGGGSVLSNQGMNNGGAGGGYSGRRGEASRNNTSFAGGGGTQSAGGIGGNGGNQAGNPGTSLQGGSTGTNNYGGGGGGGYFGGGAGSFGGSNDMAGGGGGSGFVGPTVLLGATFTGTGRYPAGTDDQDYPLSSFSSFSSIGFGGIQSGHGGDGHVVLYY
jgi:hypothetical protein